MLLSTLLEFAKPLTELQSISLAQLISFLSVCTRLRRTIDLLQPQSAPGSQTASAPPTLPPDIVDFLSNHLQLPSSTVTSLWGVMKDSVWVELTPEERMKEEEALFDENGNARGISAYMYLYAF